MITFLKKIILYALPLLIIFIVPLMVIIPSREYYPLEKIVAIQTSKENNQKALYGFAYNDASHILYKKYLLEQRPAEIIALGTSRVLQFRSEFFNKPESFTNMGMGVKSLKDIDAFIDALPASSSLKTIILGLDPDMLQHADDGLSQYHEKTAFETWKDVLFLNMRKIYVDVLTRKISISQIADRAHMSPDIGIQALVSQGGFRTDGSYAYGWVLKAENKKVLLDAEINKAIGDIEHSLYKDFKSEGDQYSVLLDSILKKAAAKQIMIVGFMTPYPKIMYTYMKDKPEYSASVIELPKSIAAIFAQNKTPFYDFSDISLFGGQDDEFVDVIHGTDKMYARMLGYMGERTPILKSYLSVPNLKKMIKNEQDTLFHF